jgi:hypothetical protein
MFAAFLTSAFLEVWQQERQVKDQETRANSAEEPSPLTKAVAALLKKWMQEQQHQAKA